jgi:hypothetical protein
MKTPKTAATLSGDHGVPEPKSRVAGKLSKETKGVRERFFAPKDNGKEKLSPIQKRQNSGRA